MFKYAIAFILALATPATAGLLEETEHLMFEINLQVNLQANTQHDLPKPTHKSQLTDEGCLAVAIYHEARGESLYGQVAVASVVLQRAAVPGRWGSTLCDVVTAIQFEFMRKDGTFPAIKNSKAWLRSVIIAKRMMAFGPIKDLPYVDHYHTTNIAPYWREHMNPVVVIGKHIFYADPISIRRVTSNS